jgi:hypothetical protein
MAGATVSDYTSKKTVIEDPTILASSDAISDLDIMTTTTKRFVGYFFSDKITVSQTFCFKIHISQFYDSPSRFWYPCKFPDCK